MHMFLSGRFERCVQGAQRNADPVWIIATGIGPEQTRAAAEQKLRLTIGDDLNTRNRLCGSLQLKAEAGTLP